MMTVGIESMNAYVGRTSLGVRELFEARGLDTARFENLMMERKSVNLPCEDPVSNAVNAAKPIVDALPADARGHIEAVIVGTESGLDFGKPISTYVHDYLGLGRRVRSFEVKHACYGGTAALQAGLGLVVCSANPEARVLVVAADAASVAARNTYWEPSQGAGAVAMLLSRRPEILEVDLGASGFYSYEVMDTCRPRQDLEAGDSDLSILSYLRCLEESFLAYRERVGSADIRETFEHLVFHTPFAGMVKGAHRTMMRKLGRCTPGEIEADFGARLSRSLVYCQQVGNVYSAALYLALCSFIDNTDIQGEGRVGLFSYGSGCASEFYSGVVTPESKAKLARQRIVEAIASRRRLTIPEYELVSDLALQWKGAVEEGRVDRRKYAAIYDECFAGRGLLLLSGVRRYRREYAWS